MRKILEEVYVTLLYNLDEDDFKGWKKLREELEKAVEEVKGVKLMAVNLGRTPDPFILTDPDKPPPGFR